MKHKMENIREKFVEKKNEIMEFVDNEDGVGVIELVLVLVVLIGLVIIFKTQITQLLNNIFKEINSQSQEVY
jgi:Flp pilus assembly pilin Flp